MPTYMEKIKGLINMRKQNNEQRMVKVKWGRGQQKKENFKKKRKGGRCWGWGKGGLRWGDNARGMAKQ